MKPRPATRDWPALAERFAKAVTAEQKHALAEQLCVTVEALDAIAVGWATVADLHAMTAGGDGWDETYPEGAYTFPEQDGGGRVVGLSLRAEDGRKGFPRGGQRGLVVPRSIDEFSGLVLCVEGASDVAACLALGIGAVGRPSNNAGAACLAERFRGWDVLVAGENDEKEDGTSWPGRKGAMEVAAKLAGKWARPVRWTLPPGGVKDIRAWLRAKIADGLLLDDAEACRAAGRELLAALEPNAQRAEPKRAGSGVELVRVADVKPKEVHWLWPARIPRGKLTLIAGDPGLGKSFLTLDIAARVSCGRAWPDTPDAAGEPGGVVLLSAEDDVADTIRPRLDASGADVDRLVCLRAVFHADGNGGERREMLSLSRDLAALEDAIHRVERCRLVVVDPVAAYLGRADADDNAQVRGMLALLADLAAQTGVAVIAVTHFRKAMALAVHRSIGSIGFVAAARAAWAVVRDPDDPGRRLLLPIKNNIAPDMGGLAFRLRAHDGAGGIPAVVWEPGAVSVTADELLAVERTRDRRTDRPKRDKAADWLRDQLVDGPRPVHELEAAAARDKIAWRTVRRAKGDLGIHPARHGYSTDGAWSWDLPATSSNVANSSSAETVATFEDRGQLWTDGPANGVHVAPPGEPASKVAELYDPALGREALAAFEDHGHLSADGPKNGVAGSRLVEPAPKVANVSTPPARECDDKPADDDQAITVPTGWTRGAWARHCRHMAESCEAIDPRRAEWFRRSAAAADSSGESEGWAGV